MTAQPPSEDQEIEAQQRAAEVMAEDADPQVHALSRKFAEGHRGLLDRLANP